MSRPFAAADSFPAEPAGPAARRGVPEIRALSRPESFLRSCARQRFKALGVALVPGRATIAAPKLRPLIFGPQRFRDLPSGHDLGIYAMGLLAKGVISSDVRCGARPVAPTMRIAVKPAQTAQRWPSEAPGGAAPGRQASQTCRMKARAPEAGFATPHPASLTDARSAPSPSRGEGKKEDYRRQLRRSAGALELGPFHGPPKIDSKPVGRALHVTATLGAWRCAFAGHHDLGVVHAVLHQIVQHRRIVRMQPCEAGRPRREIS